MHRFVATCAGPVFAAQAKMSSALRMSLLLSMTACGVTSGRELATDDIVGAFHLPPPQVDAVNLSLISDGTLRWTISGCDFGGDEIGRWVIDGDVVRLQPADGRSELYWVDDVSFRNRVPTLEAMIEGNVLHVVGTGIDQRWQRGVICPVCGTPGYEGPSGLEECPTR